MGLFAGLHSEVLPRGRRAGFLREDFFVAVRRMEMEKKRNYLRKYELIIMRLLTKFVDKSIIG